MAPEYHRIDLAGLALSPGQGVRLHREVRPGALRLGGQRYEVAGGTVPILLEVSRTASGHAFHVAFSARFEGPCMRCLEDAAVPIEVEAREIHQPANGDEELESPYVDGDSLDVGGWAHDALALVAPAQMLCREDCAGLCPVCGESLNDAETGAHDHAQPSGPFAGLGDLLAD
jgi:uncharacterized protein